MIGVRSEKNKGEQKDRRRASLDEQATQRQLTGTGVLRGHLRIRSEEPGVLLKLYLEEGREGKEEGRALDGTKDQKTRVGDGMKWH